MTGPVILVKRKTTLNVPNKLIILKDEDRRVAKQHKKQNMSSVWKLEMVFNLVIMLEILCLREQSQGCVLM